MPDETIHIVLYPGNCLVIDFAGATGQVVLNDWLKPKSDSGGDYHPDPVAIQEAMAVYGAAIQTEGQLAMKV